MSAEMGNELGKGNTYPDLLEKLAQYEFALEKFMPSKSWNINVRRVRQ